MTMTVSHAARSSSTPLSAAARRRVPSKRNGVVTMPDRERAELARDPRDDRCGAGAGAAALARGDEHHVRAAQRGPQLVHRLLGGGASDRRVGARAEPLRQALADRDLRRRVRDRERLPVGVHGDEVDLGDPRVHHPVDRVQPGAADADDADRRDVRGALRRRHAVELRRRLEHRLEVAGGGARRGSLRRHLRPRARRPRRPRTTGGSGAGSFAKSGTCSTVSSSAACARGIRLGLGRLASALGRLALRALRGLGLAEELGQRALTHRRALARHRAPPSRGRGTPGRRDRTGRT